MGQQFWPTSMLLGAERMQTDLASWGSLPGVAVWIMSGYCGLSDYKHTCSRYPLVAYQWATGATVHHPHRVPLKLAEISASVGMWMSCNGETTLSMYIYKHTNSLYIYIIFMKIAWYCIIHMFKHIQIHYSRLQFWDFVHLSPQVLQLSSNSVIIWPIIKGANPQKRLAWKRAEADHSSAGSPSEDATQSATGNDRGVQGKLWRSDL